MKEGGPKARPLRYLLWGHLFFPNLQEAIWMSKKMLFIFNPRSGKGSIKNRLMDILDIFVKGGYEVTFTPPSAIWWDWRWPGKRRQNYDIVVASGGDGTLDEIVTGMMLGGYTNPIGYIPSGSTNDFANSFHISKNMLQAATDIVEGLPHAFDVGRFNDDYFVYIAAFGLFTVCLMKRIRIWKIFWDMLLYIRRNTAGCLISSHYAADRKRRRQVVRRLYFRYGQQCHFCRWI